MQESADIVVVGGGCIGVSIAYHLAKRNAGSVVLLERNQFLGQESTGKCAGGIRAQFSTEINARLSMWSIDAFEGWQDEIAEPLQFWQWGYCFLLTSDDLVTSFRRNHAMWTELGMDVEWLEPPEVEKRLPYISMDGVRGATLHMRDGFGDPSDITQGYAKAGARHGVKVETGVEVTGMELDGGRKVTAIQTNQGRIACGQVVFATGAWTRQLAAMCGVDVPIDPMRRQIIVTDKFEDIKDPFPMTVDLSTTLYFHRESGGILIGMSDHSQEPGFDDSFNEEFGEQMLVTAMERAPVLENASPKHKWAGYYEVTPDHHPIIDRMGHVSNAFVCAGFSGHGLMHAPAAGFLTAELMLDGKATTIDLHPLRLSRFEDMTSLHKEANVI